MSRIGNKLITIPAGVTVEVAAGNEVTVKGPKGTLTRKFSDLMEIKVEENQVTVHNMVVGVSEGFTKSLELVGIGFRTAVKGNVLTMNVGYSHQVEMPIADGLQVTCPSATEITVAGIDKQLVGEFAANIRAVRKPEPYKGKGIRYKGEHIRRKEGKTAGKK